MCPWVPAFEIQINLTPKNPGTHGLLWGNDPKPTRDRHVAARIKLIPRWCCHFMACCGWWLGAFQRWWPPSALWVGPFIFYGHTRRCPNNPTFSNLGLCAACWACFMCHPELWPSTVSHPLSLNSSLSLTGGKYFQKITIPIFRFVAQNCVFPGYFPYIIFFSYLCSLVAFDWFVIADCPMTCALTDNGLAPNRRRAIIWTNADPIHWRIYATLGGDEF